MYSTEEAQFTFTSTTMGQAHKLRLMQNKLRNLQIEVSWFRHAYGMERDSDAKEA